jgi:cell division protein FtsZ
MKAPVPSNELLHVSSVHARRRILVLGLGGAGGNCVSRMAEGWSDGPVVVAMNTDTQALAGCTTPRCLQIGPKVSHGLGAGGDTTVGRLAAEESIELIQEVVSEADLLFLVVGLGGGTGTGAAPVVAQAARKLGALTLCFVTMPFPFEGDRRRRQAEDGLRALQHVADTVVCLPNERLLELAPQESGLPEAFRVADQIVGTGIHGLWQLLSQTGVINLDLADVRQLAERSGGCCAYGFSRAEGPARTAMVLQNLVASPLLEKGRLLSEAAALLVNITGGQDLTLADFRGLMGQIASMARPGAHLFCGAIVDPAYRGKLALTVLASENWLEERTAARGIVAKPPAETPSTPDRKVEELQLDLTPANRGRFNNVEPTYHKGEDLDIPTFIRRNVRLSFEK